MSDELKTPPKTVLSAEKTRYFSSLCGEAAPHERLVEKDDYVSNN
jgi:hypothetical protein